MFIEPDSSDVAVAAFRCSVRGLGTWVDARRHSRRQGEEGSSQAAERAVAGCRAQTVDEGNTRYVDGTSRRHDFKHEREALVGGQNPFEAVLSCADSRIAPEYAFDSARGDLFVCRVAGNFANDETVASMEYAVAVLGTPMILVLGHDSCGAVDATIKSLKDDKPLPGHIPSLVAAIAPSVKASAQQSGNALDNAIRQNVIDNVARMKSAAPILNAAVEQNKLKVVGGIYRLATGKVDLVN
jgi:carbonic anhydrase